MDVCSKTWADFPFCSFARLPAGPSDPNPSMSQLELDPVLVTPLRRPETRPRKRRRSKANQTSPYIMKAAVGIVAVTALVVFAGRITAFAMEPLVVTMRTGQQIQGLKDQRKQEAQTNEQLRQDIAYLKTPAGIEQEARRRGWVRPGEVALSIVQPEVPAGAPAVKPEKHAIQTASAKMTFSDRVQSVLDTCLAVFGGSRTR